MDKRPQDSGGGKPERRGRTSMFGVNDWLRFRLIGLVICILAAGFMAISLMSYRNAVIRRVADAAARTLRATNMICRRGGEDEAKRGGRKSVRIADPDMHFAMVEPVGAE
jgi:hypothetical protein